MIPIFGLLGAGVGAYGAFPFAAALFGFAAEMADESRFGGALLLGVAGVSIEIFGVCTGAIYGLLTDVSIWRWLLHK